MRLIGGDGEDTFAVDANVRQKNKLFIYDRSDEPNKLPAAAQARLKTSTDTAVNQCNKTSFRYNFLPPLLLASYSKDYGFQLIGDFIYQKQGFRKDPYAFRRSLLVNYGFGASA